MDLNKLQKSIPSKKVTGQSDDLPPVDSWDPPFCGDIGMQIKRNGQWYYQGTPIGRQKLVRLFSTILKKEDDQYFLVTPVEKVSVDVEDVPFIITEWSDSPEGLSVVTQTNDRFTLGVSHPVELRHDNASDSQIPYINVRRNLWARVHQNVYYQWIEKAELIPLNDKTASGEMDVILYSGDYQFSLGTTKAG